MTDELEQRLRRALSGDVREIPAGELSDDVRRGARRRQRRVGIAAAAASVCAVVVVAGLVWAVGTPAEGPRPGPRPDSTGPVSQPTDASTTVTDPPTTATEPPPDLYRGTADIAASGEAFFRLTVNTGCDFCATFWRREDDGTWVRLHDFGEETWAERADEFPLARLVMAPNGRDGWAWGHLLFETHDGGSTWERVRGGPGRSGQFGHQVAANTTHVFATDGARRMWVAPVEGGRWRRAAPGGPDFDLQSIGDHVVGFAADEGLSSPRLAVSRDGRSWVGQPMPCRGETRVTAGGDAAFVYCGSGARGRIWRSVQGGAFEEFGPPVAAESILAVDSRRVLVIGRRDMVVSVDPEGSQPTEVPNLYDVVAIGDQVIASPASGRDSRLLESSDGGVTWRRTVP